MPETILRSMTSQAGRLRTITVNGLFGRFDYEITLEPDDPTVITGLNGTGKSTILRMVDAVSRGDLPALIDFPVESFQLTFDGIEPVIFDRDANARVARISWGDLSHLQDITWNLELASLPTWAIEAVREHPDGTDELVESLRRHAGPMSFVEFSEGRELALSLWRRRSDLVTPDWFTGIREAFPVLFITDQRLVAEPGARREPHRGRPRLGARPIRVGQRTIERASRDIASRIQDADSRYARVSQRQDRTFPNHVIAAMKRGKKMSAQSVGKLSREVDVQRERLRLVGLLDGADAFGLHLDPSDLEDPNVRSVVATIFESDLQKLSVLNGLAERLAAFKAFLDRRYAPKSVQLSRQGGIRILTPNGGEIRPSELSSGEQQMAVLAYEILFRAEDATVVIIDEPEISLHVLWQDTLIEDLATMGGPSGLQFLMATHSPTILANHQHLERSLDLLAR